MPVPSSIDDISTTAGENYPVGGDSPSVLDDHIRTAYSFIAVNRDAIELKANESEVLKKDGSVAMTGLLKFAQGANIASASTVNLSTATGNTVYITGVVTITAFTMTAGQVIDVIFGNTLTLTHHATNNNLPGGANITTAAGDCARYFYDGATVRCISYTNANGKAVVETLGAADKTKLDGIAAGATAITLSTAVNSTSGTFIDFTGIPSTAKRITVMFQGVSLNGAAHLLIQLGNSGGIVSSGYGSGGIHWAGSGQLSMGASNGFAIFVGSAARVTDGSMVLTLSYSGAWTSTHAVNYGSGGDGAAGGGSVTGLGTVDRIRITTTSGTDTFDAGKINISWE